MQLVFTHMARASGKVSVTLDGPYLTREEAAERVRQTPRTIDNWRRKGLLVVRYTAGGRPLFLESSLWKPCRPNVDPPTR